MEDRPLYHKSKLLLVEGADDERFFSGLAAYLKLSDIQIMDYKGKDRLLIFLKGAINDPSFRENVMSVGIIRDADNLGVERAKQSVRTALFNAKFIKAENRIEPVDTNFQIDVCILRDTSGLGRLEEMILEAIASDWRMPCIADYLDCIVNSSPNEEELPKDHGKAKLGIYLASQITSAVSSGFWEDAEDALHLDTAIKRRYLNLDHSAYQEAKDFLLKL